jgi:hypothetical protein
MDKDGPMKPRTSRTTGIPQRLFCPKCGSDATGVVYDPDADILRCTCPTCGWKWRALTQQDVESRDRTLEILRMHYPRIPLWRPGNEEEHKAQLVKYRADCVKAKDEMEKVSGFYADKLNKNQ